MDNLYPEFPVTGNSSARFPRNGEFLLSPRRVSAMFPGPLNFARQAVAEFERAGASLERVRLEVDAEGRGTALYRFTMNDEVLHYLVVSNALADDEKTDHNTGEVWDVMSALCTGPWSKERESDLLRELPKQRNGRPDSDTLVYARGNRSGRLFDHVVESLAAGRQPDADRLSAIGYIVRTTSFVGNGLLGMRSFKGYGERHPLRRPYHAQLCAAFLLREFVCDLVDAMAAARAGAAAARLDTAFRRALGLGNSAGPGLVYFAANHPRLINHWIQIQESALALARSRPVEHGQIGRLQALLERAASYFSQSYPDRNGIFHDPALLSSELTILAGRAAIGPATWGELRDQLCCDASIEAGEIVDAILLELNPDIVADSSDGFVTDESLAVDPAMTIAALKEIVNSAYAWAVQADRNAGSRRFFWYRSEDAPGDSRRGIRGIIPEIEHETPLDVVMNVGQLVRELDRCGDDELVGHFLLSRPKLSYIVARVQTLADMDTAEYRADYNHPELIRLIPPRLILSFYGMEKLDTQMPRSVRGVLLQGAPTAADIEAGREGTWPFAIFPGAGRAASPAPKESRVAAKEAAIGSDTASIVVKPPGRRRRYVDTSGRSDTHVRVSPVELVRALQKAFQGAGMSFGDSIQTAELVILGQSMGRDTIKSCLKQIEVWPGSVTYETVPTPDEGSTPIIDLQGRGAMADMVRIGHFLLAEMNSRGCAAVVGRRTFGMVMLDALAFRLAQPGNAVCLAWRGNGGFTDEAGRTRMAAAFGAPKGTFLTEISVVAHGAATAGPFDAPAWKELLSQSVAGRVESFATSVASALAPGDYAVFVTPMAGHRVPDLAGSAPAEKCDDAAIERARAAGLAGGIALPRDLFDRVMLLSERVRVPGALEEFIAAG